MRLWYFKQLPRLRVLGKWRWRQCQDRRFAVLGAEGGLSCDQDRQEIQSA